MIANLFSVFDPVSSLGGLSLNWLRTIIGLFLLPCVYWLIPGRYNYFFIKIMSTLHLEFKVLLGISFMPGITLVFVALFLFIVFNNFIGLFPYVFTSSSHLSFTLTLSLPL